MADIEQDDTEDIFQECDSVDTKAPVSENIIYATEIDNQQGKTTDLPNCNQTTSRNHLVVHIGIFIVLLTTYLGITSVQKCLVNCVENTSAAEQVKQHREEVLNYLQQTEKHENTNILQRFLEYKDICKDLEIFTKQQEISEEESADNEDNRNGILHDTETDNGDIDEPDDSSGSSGNGGCAKENSNKHKKSKYSIKTSSTKNGFNKYNKSTKAKNQKNPKKDLNLNKKTSTAEPIIYLFALVFIYLLLKAASDINQHYKSQNKNDKRLRRCSLQSYAQTHRPDRRASKELALKQKQQQLQQRLKSLSRSSSQDQQHYNQYQQQHLIDVSPQKSSELKQQSTTGTPILPKVSPSNNWQLLRQHTTTQSLDNSDILNNTRVNTELYTSRMARRCSVPAALSHQRQKLSNASPLSIANDHINFNVSSSRRTSIVSSHLSLTMDPNDSSMLETKRRVRMINRH